MTIYHDGLPQLAGRLFLTDGGIETTLIFHEGIELPYFAAFTLLDGERNRDMLTRYYEGYLEIAREDGTGFVLESPTWRASADWGEKLGYSTDALAAANQEAVRHLIELRARHESDDLPIVVSGCIGPRGDGYDPGQLMSSDEARAYHERQVEAFAAAGADMATAITMTNADEATGVARAAGEAGLPVAISFTVETDGRLPTGQSLEDAIAAVDAATSASPEYYMINCAHPEHFADALPANEAWTKRIRGLRANASRCSHEELDNAPDLDEGDPAELGGQYRDLLRRHPQINVLGGCCGTDVRHVRSISRACRSAA